MRRQMLLVLTVSLLLAADAADDAAKKDLKLFEGTWKITSMEAEGMKLPEDQFKNDKLVCKGNEFTYTDAGGAAHKGTFKIDPTKKPKTMDITFTDGPNKGETMLGIYEISEDTYKLCMKPMSKDRPTEFSSKAGSGQVVEVLKKEKK
jgi:uncharacterized protein (TIGR03067 family)